MEVNISQAKTLVTDALRAGLVPNLLGSPGLGKSDLIREVAEDLNLFVIDIRLAQSDPTDLNGFPALNVERTRSHYAPPTTFPLAGDKPPEGYKGWLLFFDEMTSAPPSVQAAAYKVVLDRMVGEHKLHNNVAMVCAGNLSTDKAIVNRMSTAMQSRLIHLHLRVDVDEWLDWAIDNKIDYRIIGFIRFRNELLHKFNPNHNDRTFPCPRTWHFLSKLCDRWGELTMDKLPLIEGTVGEGAALEFKGVADIFASLPSVQQIMEDPASVVISEEPSIRYALTALLSARATENNITKLLLLIERLPIEFQVITMQGIIQTNPDMEENSDIIKWVSKSAIELIRT